MQGTDKKYYADENNGGLNSDSDAFALGTNEWVNCENLRSGSTDKGVTGTLESIGGNTLLSTDSLTNMICIGSVSDDANNRILYFLYDNSGGGNHVIMAYYKSANKTYTVLSNTNVTGGLNFNKNYPIQSWIVGNLLYWTDNYTNPKRINIDAGIKAYDSTFSTSVTAYTLPLLQSVITIIRQPPLRPPSTSLVSIPSRQNSLKNFSGQFSFRIQYRDGETSVFGSPSAMVNYRIVSSTVNTVIVSLPYSVGYEIEQDVQVYELAVRYDNQPEYFIIKSWDKRNASDLAEINAYNSGGSLIFYFYNDRVGEAVGAALSVKPFDSVPLLSATGTSGLDRNFLGGNTIGYDTPTTTSISGSLPVNAGGGQQCFKTYSTYQLGIRFKDEYKRSCGVVTNPLQSIVTIPDRGDANTLNMPAIIQVNISLSNTLVEIPEWAYYYDVLITKNLRTRFFAQWAMVSSDAQYVIKNVDGTYTYQNTNAGSLFGLAFKTSNLTSYGMGIQFTEGDLLRVYLNGLSIQPFTLSVVAQDADYIICSPYDIGNISSLTGLILVEYYTPYKPSDNEIFYTTGISNPIVNPGTISRTFGSTFLGNIDGDSTLFVRTAYSTGAYGYYQESMSPNDNLWKNWFGIYGEANVVTKLGRAVKNTSVKWSNTLIQGSNTNGLSSFDSLDEKLLPMDMGALRKLQQTSKVSEQGNVLLAISEQQTASIYLGEVQVVASSQNAFLSSSPSVIGTINILKGNFGTINPESVTEFRGSVFWVDVNNGKVIQYASNGLFPISNYKMVRFWNLWCRKYKSMTSAEIEALGGRPFIFTTVDPIHNELLISLPKLSSEPPKGYLPDYPSTIYPFDIYDLQAKTMVFSLSSQPNHWHGCYTFQTENFVTMNNDLYTFRNGHLWIHNQTDRYNNFFGVQYKSRIMGVSNISPTIPKSYNNISLESNICPTFVYVYNNYPYQQSSDLVDYDFKSLEGIWYATFYRNKLQPTATGFTSDGLLTGEKLRNVAMFILIEFSEYNQAIEVKFLNIGFTISEGHQNWIKK